MTWRKLAYNDEVASLTAVAPDDVTHAAAAVGTGTAAAREDHKHDLDEGLASELAPVDGTAESLGTNDAIPHIDHVHDLGPLVADLNFSQQEAVGLALHTAASAPNAASEVEGQIYFNTATDDVWVWDTGA